MNVIDTILHFSKVLNKQYILQQLTFEGAICNEIVEWF